MSSLDLAHELYATLRSEPQDEALLIAATLLGLLVCAAPNQSSARARAELWLDDTILSQMSRGRTLH